jgi:hypothetical protein
LKKTTSKKTQNLLRLKLQLIILLCFSFLQGTHVEAADSAVTQARKISTQQAAAKQNNTPPTIAAKRRRRRAPQRLKSSHRRRRPRRRRMRSLAKKAIKGSVGIVSGIKDAGSLTLAGGAEYIMPFGKNISLSGGISGWLNDDKGEIVATRLLLMSPFAGANYLYRIDRGMWVEGHAKLLFASLSKTVNTYNEAEDTLDTVDTKLSSAGMMVGGSFHYDIGGMAVGPEVLMPFYFNSEFEGLNGISALLFLEFHL